MRNTLILCVLFTFITAVCVDGDVTSDNGLSQYKKMNISWFNVLTKVKEKMQESEIAMIDKSSQTVIERANQDNSISWEDCGSANDLATILSVSFDPDPPQKGALFSIAIKTQLYTEVSGGNVFVNIKYLGYIPVLKETLDLCAIAAQSKDSCPLAMGVHENYISDTFPDFALSGQYSGTVKAVDESDKDLSCIKVKFSL